MEYQFYSCVHYLSKYDDRIMSRSGFRISQRKCCLLLHSWMLLLLKNVFSESAALSSVSWRWGSVLWESASVVYSRPALQWGRLDFCAMQLCFCELGPGSNTSAPHPAAASINVSACPSKACWEFATPPDRSEGNKREQRRVCDTVKVFHVTLRLVTDSPDPSGLVHFSFIR